MTKPVSMWAVLDFDGQIIEYTVERTRKKAIAAWLAMWTKPSYLKWAHWYQGYRARRVTIQVQP